MRLICLCTEFEEYLPASNPYNAKQSNRYSHLYVPFQTCWSGRLGMRAMSFAKKARMN